MTFSWRENKRKRKLLLKYRKIVIHDQNKELNTFKAQLAVLLVKNKNSETDHDCKAILKVLSTSCIISIVKLRWLLIGTVMWK